MENNVSHSFRLLYLHLPVFEAQVDCCNPSMQVQPPVESAETSIAPTNLPVAVPVPAAAGLPVEDVVMPPPPFEAKEPALTVPSDDPAVDAQLESLLAPVKNPGAGGP